jgi:hypothetical protein
MRPAWAQRQEELLSGGERGQVSTFDRVNFFDMFWKSSYQWCIHDVCQR